MMGLRFGIKNPFNGVLLAFFGLALALSGCGPDKKPVELSKKPNQTGVLRLNLGTEPPSLDPIKVTDLTSFSVLLQLMRGLTRLDANGHVQPAVAGRWEALNGGLLYRFYLRKNARWSDGKPVTAQQFLAAFKRGLTPSNGAAYASFLLPIKGASRFYAGKTTDFSTVAVKAKGLYVLEIQLERPLAFFTSLMASPVCLPLREDLLNRYGERFTEAGNLVSNGPYLLSQWQHDQSILLKPNPYYWKPLNPSQTGINAVEFAMINDASTSGLLYDQGELDLIESPTTMSGFEVRQRKNRADAHWQNLHAIYYLGFNVKQPPFNNPKIRQAFGLSIDRSYFPRLLQSGQRPESSFLTPGLLGYNPKLGLNFNSQKAQQLLAEAGYPNGKGFPKVRFAFRSSIDQRKEAEILQFLWKKHLGIAVELQPMDWKVLLSTLKTQPPELFRMSWYVDYPDPDSFLSLFASQSGNSYGRWQSLQYDRLVEQAAHASKPERRIALYTQAQRLLLEEETAVVPLYSGQKLWQVQPWVNHLQVDAMNLTMLDEAVFVHP